MLNELEKYWLENGIAAQSFTCSYETECRRGDFAGPKEAYVGEYYESGDGYPRILFVSLDSGMSEPTPLDRTWPAVREGIMKKNIEEFKKGKHWYRTIDFAYRILNNIMPQRVTCMNDAKPFLAHINSAKCCMNKDGNRQADKVLFKNCKQYIPGEIKILSPDILITQGNYARSSVSFKFNELCEVVTHKFKNGTELDYHLFRLNDKQILWLHTYHPTTSHYNRTHYHILDELADIAVNFYKS